MSVLTSLSFLILVVLIQSFLQLPSGVFTLFYHYALGKNSKKRAADLSLFYIAGVETISVALFLASYFLVYILFLNQPNFESSFLAWIFAGIFLIFSIISAFLYFRKSAATTLFIPRSFARAFNENAKNVKTRSDAFALGAFAASSELLFSLPLLLVASIELMRFDSSLFPREILAFLLILLPLLPLFFLRTLFRTGHNLAEIERLRVHNKNFFRLILSLSYLALAVLIIIFRIISYGNF
ncbi:hypothetical protein IJJ49_02705 [Candidatus Saccharibacteria bacterium]|nr:hypothetical protein [Candidatus Saccharibacteria bacterium]